MRGTIVGQYRIADRIGEGGMGAVFAAEHTLLGRPAAVKVLLPSVSQNQEIVARFFNEARAATAIRHPGIVEIYDFGYHSDGSAYIVMELLQGEPLSTRMARGRMSSSSALAIVRQIAGALAAAHAKGIVHRDLKPDNVFLVPDPEVPGGERIKLLDFGIAKLVGDDPHGQKTRTGAVMGTPTYMSPEQCRGVAVDHRADLYSLGCILFELSTGRPPYIGEGVGDVLAAHIHVAPPLIASLAPDVPPEIDRLVQRLLVKDPAQRVQSAEEIVHAADLASGGPAYRTGPRVGYGGPPIPTSPMIPPPTTLSGSAQTVRSTHGAGEPPRGKVGLYVGIGAAVIAAAVVAIVVASGGGGGSASGNDDRGPATAAQPTTTTEPAASGAPSPVAAPPVAPPPVTPPPVAPPPVTPPPVAPAAEVDVSIVSTPPGAELVLDGVVLGTTPFAGKLPRAAQVTLVVRLRGYKDASLKVSAEAAIEQRITLEKKKGGRTPKPGDGRDQSVNPFGP